MNDKLCPNIKFSERQNISDMDSIIEDVMTINMCLSREEQQREIQSRVARLKNEIASNLNAGNLESKSLF